MKLPRHFELAWPSRGRDAWTRAGKRWDSASSCVRVGPGKKLGQLRPSNAGKDGKEWLLLEELQGQIARFGTLMTE
uniref:Uncharacterized protein n=1 Tax=Oryza nivara TaxID=4536 RepID=A0A0E0GL47_ORYNI